MWSCDAWISVLERFHTSLPPKVDPGAQPWMRTLGTLTCRLTGSGKWTVARLWVLRYAKYEMDENRQCRYHGYRWQSGNKTMNMIIKIKKEAKRLTILPMRETKRWESRSSLNSCMLLDHFILGHVFPTPTLTWSSWSRALPGLINPDSMATLCFQRLPTLYAMLPR